MGAHVRPRALPPLLRQGTATIEPRAGQGHSLARPPAGDAGTYKALRTLPGRDEAPLGAQQCCECPGTGQGREKPPLQTQPLTAPRRPSPLRADHNSQNAARGVTPDDGGTRPMAGRAGSGRGGAAGGSGGAAAGRAGSGLHSSRGDDAGPFPGEEGE